jgi:REP element-mobilizing transposase RayT
MCAHRRECIFGEVVDDEMVLNEMGRIVEEEWLRTPSVRPEVELDHFVVMPNHVHGIVIINDRKTKHNPSVGTHGRASLHRKPRSLSSLVAGFKSIVTKRINIVRGTMGTPIWQARFHDHIHPVRYSR